MYREALVHWAPAHPSALVRSVVWSAQREDGARCARVRGESEVSVFFTSSCHNKEPLIDAVCLSCALVETIRTPALRAPCRCGGAFARAAGRRVVLLLGGAAGRGPAGCARGAQKSAIRAYAPERLALFPRTNSRVALNSNVQRKDAHGFTRAGVRTRRTEEDSVW